MFSWPECSAISKLSIESTNSASGKTLDRESDAATVGKGLFEKIEASSCFGSKGFRKG